MRVGERGRREENEIKSCMGIGIKEVEGDLGFHRLLAVMMSMGIKG